MADENFHQRRTKFFCRICNFMYPAKNLRTFSDMLKQDYETFYKTAYPDLGPNFPTQICEKCRKHFRQAKNKLKEPPILFETTEKGRAIYRNIRRIEAHSKRSNGKWDDEYECSFCDQPSFSKSTGLGRAKDGTFQKGEDTLVNKTIEKDTRDLNGRFKSKENVQNGRRSQNFQHACGKPIRPGVKCVLPVGRGIDKHTVCSEFRNAVYLQNQIEKSGSANHIVPAICRQKEAENIDAGGDKNDELVFQSIGAPYKMRRSVTPKVKGWDMNKLIDRIRKKPTSKTGIREIIRDIKSSGGNCPSFVDYDREIESRHKFLRKQFDISKYIEMETSYYATHFEWLPESCTIHQFESSGRELNVVDENCSDKDLIPDVSIRKVKKSGQKYKYEKYTSIGYIKHMVEFLNKIKEMRGLADLRDDEIILKYRALW